ncbi:hypothetical protein [Streptomyces mirabilis]
MDPLRHPFELHEDAAKELAGRVAPLLPDADAAEEKRWRSLDPVTEFLVDRYGRWACGGNWSVGEGDTDGGVVGAWCCAADSVTPRRTQEIADRTPEMYVSFDIT